MCERKDEGREDCCLENCNFVVVVVVGGLKCKRLLGEIMCCHG